MKVIFAENVIMEIGFTIEEKKAFFKKIKLDRFKDETIREEEFQFWCEQHLAKVKGVIAVIKTSLYFSSIVLRAENEIGIQNAILYLENFLK